MNLRRPLTVLVYSFAVCVVAFGVLMGGYALSQATGDQVGAVVYWRVATACLTLLVVNTVLLVGVLGVEALGRADRNDDQQADRQDPTA